MVRFYLHFIFIGTLANALIRYDPKSGGPVVTLSTGSVEGRFLQTESGAKGFVFQGVPYIEPPLGPLRFTRPVPKEPWAGTLSVKEYRPACPQNASISPQNFLDEDCVYANVFAGIHCSAENPCPVIYYIHGGGYEFDSVWMFPPEVQVENFADQGLVFVLISYRLGILGFFSTGTEDARGNWAMEDMVEGMRWVQREIHHFGGDKSKVTVIGHSSSAHAVSLLTMAPKTEGLFHRAVIMSGTSMREDSLNNDITDFKTVSIALGCATKLDWFNEDKYKYIVECMRTIPSDVLVNTFNDVRCCDENATRSAGQIGRFIIKDSMGIELPSRITTPKNDGPFGLFPKPLSQMIAERRPVPTMTGTVKNEGSGVKGGFMNATGFTTALMCDFVVQGKNYRHPKRISRECKKNYVLYANPDESRNSSSSYPFWSEQIQAMFDDVGYFAPNYEEASTLRSAGATVYLYSFDYEKVGMEGISPWHSFDLTYLVGIHPKEFDERDYEIKKIYVPLFVNYAKYGNPTPADPNSPTDVPAWTPLTSPNGYNYLSVNLPTQMKPEYHKRGCMLWNDKVDEIENEWTRNEENNDEKRVTFFDKPTKTDKSEMRVSSTTRTTTTTSKFEEEGGFNWQTAFWVVSSLFLASVTVLVVLSFYVWRRKNRIFRQSTAEERALLGSLKYADSYDSLNNFRR